MRVRKKTPYDGSALAGNPTGPYLQVKEIIDHKPKDGPVKPKCVALLSDDTWEFVWNLEMENEEEAEEEAKEGRKP